MKRSIRTTFIGLFIGLLAMVLLAVWAMNSFFLENYYLNDKVKILQDTYTQINAYAMEKAAAGEDIMDDLQSLYSKDGEQNEITRLIRNVNEKYNITVVIVDSTNDETYPSFWDGRLLADRVQQYILGKRGPKTETLVHEENYTIEKSFDKHAKSFYLQNWGFFEDNKTIFIMSMPIASIHESVDLSNRFMVYIGLIALAAGSIIMYFAGKKITSPILSLAALSERMSELDFDARYTGDSEDEIGVLGNSMNTLSEKLKETIGELKTANNELQKDIEEKIRIDEARKEFIANVSHELKTPLTSISGYAEIMKSGIVKPEDMPRFSEKIYNEARRLITLVEDIIKLSHLDEGKVELERQDVDFYELTREIISRLSPQASAKKVHMELTGESVIYNGVRQILDEMVYNICENAIKYNKEGGEIRVWVGNTLNGKKIIVTDTGIGIPKNQQERIFERFYRVDKSHSKEIGGTGLGLSIVKHGAILHNAKIHVDSELGKGTRMELTF